MAAFLLRPSLPALSLACLLALACGGDPGEKSAGDAVPLFMAPRSQAPEAPSQDPALAAYYEAKRCVSAGDLEGARARLREATEADPEFAEAWYQLGATETNLAVRTVNYDEGTAVQLFRDGVDHKRTAESLLRQGSCRVWNPVQQSQSQDDLERGLEGVDELLEDEPALVSALKLYAARAR